MQRIKYCILGYVLMFVLMACNQSAVDGILVKDLKSLNEAVENAKPGDQIILANGIWIDTEIKVSGEGTQDQPIKLIAQEKGKVFLEGQSNLRISGNYIHVEGLVFRNGHTPTGEVIAFKNDKGTFCNNCRITECVIDNYNPTERFESDYWVGMYGKNNRFDHNYLVGKRNLGVTMAVRLNHEQCLENFHRIDHNYFGMHPILGSNGGETLRLGTSHHSLKNSNTLVEDNYFERCNGEHEIISNKSCQNTFRNNTFYECQGTLTMRHGNETIVDNNYFFGNNKPNTGGIRIINETQTVVNNYCEGLTGYRFRGALVVMNGVPNSPINRYFQVKDSKASNNLIINCDYVQLCAGSDEERSATPINTEISNNVFYNDIRNQIFTIYDDVSGITFRDNLLNEGLESPKYQNRAIAQGFEHKALELMDTLGVKRVIGYPNIGPDLSKERPNAENTGVSWYPKKDYSINFRTGQPIVVNPGINTIFDAVSKAQDGDVLVLESGVYHQTKAIDIPVTLSIVVADHSTQEPTISFERTSLFHIENGGSLELEGLNITGRDSDDYAGNSLIRTSRYSMIDNYKLRIADCNIHDLVVNHSFDVFRVYKNTFAESIVIENSTFSNITGNVMALDSETDDIGIYNVENVVVTNCVFTDIGGVAVKLHRGGGDESTFGPILNIDHTVFNNVGKDRRNANSSSVDLHGVQYATMQNSIFNNSQPIKMHLSVGEPVLSISNSNFYKTGDIESNSEAFTQKNIYKMEPIWNANEPFSLEPGSYLSSKGSDGKPLGILNYGSK